MKRFFNWLFILAGLVGAFYGMGLIVPRTITQASKTNFACGQEAVFEVVSDLRTWPTWHPDIAAASELPERMDHKRWSLRTKGGEMLELEVTAEEEPTHWAGVFVRNGTRVTMRFDLNWFGTGARVRMTKMADTKSPWERARNFLLPDHDAKPVAVLTALGEQLGQSAVPEED